MSATRAAARLALSAEANRVAAETGVDKWPLKLTVHPDTWRELRDDDGGEYAWVLTEQVNGIGCNRLCGVRVVTDPDVDPGVFVWHWPIKPLEPNDIL